MRSLFQTLHARVGVHRRQIEILVDEVAGFLLKPRLIVFADHDVTQAADDPCAVTPQFLQHRQESEANLRLPNGNNSMTATSG